MHASSTFRSAAAIFILYFIIDVAAVPVGVAENLSSQEGQVLLDAQSDVLSSLDSLLCHDEFQQDGQASMGWRTCRHSSSQDRAIAPEQGDWMKKAMPKISNRTLFQMTLPGTHDSGAYILYKSLLPGFTKDVYEKCIELAEKLHIPVDKIITAWALAQDTSILGQLEAGARYIDIRCGWNGTDWVTFHFEQGVKIETMIDDVRQFLLEHDSEVVVLEVSHMPSNPPADAIKALLAMIDSKLSPWLSPRSLGLQRTVGDLVQSSHRCVVTVERSWETTPWAFPSNSIYNTYANSDSLDEMKSFNDKQVEFFQSSKTATPDSLYKLSWTLTTQTRTVETEILPGHPRSLKDLALQANAALQDWANGHYHRAQNNVQNVYPYFGNILIIDFVDLSPIVDVLLEGLP